MTDQSSRPEIGTFRVPLDMGAILKPTMNLRWRDGVLEQMWRWLN